MKTKYQTINQEALIELNNIKKWISANSIDDNVKYLTKYYVIKACGTIEIIFKLMINDYLIATVRHSDTHNFIKKKTIEISSNPSPKQIQNMLYDVSAVKGRQFRTVVEISHVRNAEDLYKLVEFRNYIAHGKDITSTVTYLEEYYRSGISILEELNKLLFG